MKKPQVGKNRLLSEIREFLQPLVNIPEVKEIKPLPAGKRQTGNWQKNTVESLHSERKLTRLRFNIGKRTQTVIIYLN